MTDSDLDRIEAYCAKATPGPWIIADSEIVAIKAIDAEVCVVGLETDERVMGDAQFIKRARTDLPALVKELRAARKEAQQAREIIVLAYAAMNHMGDALNAMDACSPEDEDKTTPAFDSVAAYLEKHKQAKEPAP